MKVACEQIVQEGAASALIARPGLIVGPGDPIRPLRLLAAAPGSGRRGARARVVPRTSSRSSTYATWLRGCSTCARRGRRGRTTRVGTPMPSAQLLAERCCRRRQPSPSFTWVDQHFLQAQEVEPWAGEGSLPLWLPRPEYDGMMAHDPEPAICRRSAAALARGRPPPAASTRPVTGSPPSVRPRCSRPGTPADRQQRCREAGFRAAEAASAHRSSGASESSGADSGSSSGDTAGSSRHRRASSRGLDLGLDLGHD